MKPFPEAFHTQIAVAFNDDVTAPRDLFALGRMMDTAGLFIRLKITTFHDKISVPYKVSTAIFSFAACSNQQTADMEKTKM